ENILNEEFRAIEDITSASIAPPATRRTAIMSNTLHRRLAVIAGLVISLLLLTGAALAVDTTLTGTITTSDTAFTDCDTNYAKVMPFTVSETGTYTLDSAAPPYDVATTFFYAAVVSNVTPRMNDAPMLDVINNSPLFASA